MARRWSVNSLVALALLWCLAGTEVQAQDPVWQNPASKGAPAPQPPQVPSRPQAPKLPHYPQPPQVPSRPQAPKLPEYPQPPQVPSRPQAPKLPEYPQPPQVPSRPEAPKFPHYPQPPQVPSRPEAPKFPHYPQPPQVPSRPEAPKLPEYPQPPQVPSRPEAPKFPHYPQPPQVPSRPEAPKLPEYPQPPQVPSRPQAPKFPHYPQPPQVPSRPEAPKLPEYPQPPQVPSRPQAPKLPEYPQPPQVPSRPQAPKLPHYPQPPQVPSRPQAPKLPEYPQPATPPKFPKYVAIGYDSPQEPQIPQPQKQQQPQQPQRPQIPQQPQRPAVPSDRKPTCEVPGYMRVPCGGPDISAAGCEATNCCFDGQQCYYGKYVTVQCTKDAQFIVVVARDATVPNIDLETISMLGQGQGCTHVDSNSYFAIYQFPVTACGSMVMEEPGVIIYENRMTSSFEVGSGHYGDITRDSSYELIFQCRYTGVSVETLVVEVLPLLDPPQSAAALGPIDVHLRLGNGQCTTKGCNEVDVAYTSYYAEGDYPVTKVLRDPVYVEVQLLEKTDPMLVLTLGRCWTTTSPNPHSLPQWDILRDGCPYRDDPYLSSLVPVPVSGVDFPSHYRRFLFKMFAFVDSNSMAPTKDQVYIHCSTAVCAAAPGRNCEPSCSRMKRAVKGEEQKTTEPKPVVSSGALIFTDEQ